METKKIVLLRENNRCRVVTIINSDKPSNNFDNDDKMTQNLARFDIPGGNHYSSLPFNLTNCPGKALLSIRVMVVMRMRVMMTMVTMVTVVAVMMMIVMMMTRPTVQGRHS